MGGNCTVERGNAYLVHLCRPRLHSFTHSFTYSLIHSFIHLFDAAEEVYKRLVNLCVQSIPPAVVVESVLCTCPHNKGAF